MEAKNTHDPLCQFPSDSPENSPPKRGKNVEIANTNCEKIVDTCPYELDELYYKEFLQELMEKQPKSLGEYAQQCGFLKSVPKELKFLSHYKFLSNGSLMLYEQKWFEQFNVETEAEFFVNQIIKEDRHILSHLQTAAENMGKVNLRYLKQTYKYRLKDGYFDLTLTGAARVTLERALRSCINEFAQKYYLNDFESKVKFSLIIAHIQKHHLEKIEETHIEQAKKIIVRLVREPSWGESANNNLKQDFEKQLKEAKKTWMISLIAGSVLGALGGFALSFLSRRLLK